MILTVFQDPMANLWFHLLLIAVVMIIYRELSHYNEKLRQIEDLKKLNQRWAEVFEMQRSRYQTFFCDKIESMHPSENVIFVNFNPKNRQKKSG